MFGWFFVGSWVFFWGVGGGGDVFCFEGEGIWLWHYLFSTLFNCHAVSQSVTGFVWFLLYDWGEGRRYAGT